MISIDHISKKYKGADWYALKDLTLDIGEKEIFGLLGPNGAGKTTLISILCGLIKPSSGSFTIDGLSYTTAKNEIKKQIGIVPQEYTLYPSLTARENLAYFGSMYGLHGKILKDAIEDALKRVGLLHFADKKVATYSGGMKRRVNLIVSILHKPKVLFLDEPTVGVDVQSKNVLLQFIKELNAAGTTIIYTSHHLNEAEMLCSEVAIIDQGRIMTQGRPEELVHTCDDAHNLEDVFLSLTGKALRDYA